MQFIKNFTSGANILIKKNVIKVTIKVTPQIPPKYVLN